MTVAVAVRDLRDGLAWHEFWRTFAADEIVSRYRRSRLGQLWITLSVAVFILVIGGLYSEIFDAHDTYLAYLAVGYIVWSFMADILNKGCTLFTTNQMLLQNAPIPPSALCFRLVLVEIYTFAHHLMILPVVFLWLSFWPSLGGLLQAAVGFLLLVYVAFWVALVLGILAVRFRDLAPIVQSLTRLAFFATPIIWIERDLGRWGDVITAVNPARHFLVTVRSPLIGEAVGLITYAVCIGIAGAVTALGLLLLGRARYRIVYWL